MGKTLWWRVAKALVGNVAMHLLILVVVIGLIVAVAVLPCDKDREIK